MKKELTKRYNQSKSEIEDIKNSLREIGNQERWFEWIDIYGDYIKNQREIPDTLKKQVLDIELSEGVPSLPCSIPNSIKEVGKTSLQIWVLWKDTLYDQSSHE